MRNCESDRIGEIRRHGSMKRRHGSMKRRHGNFFDPNHQPVKRPPHLRGKAIGLFYRDRNRNNFNKTAFLNFPEARRLKIELLLDSLEGEFLNRGESKNYMISQQGDKQFFSDEYMDLISVSYSEKLHQAVVFGGRENLGRNTDQLSEELHEDYLAKTENPQYREMLNFRKKLPANEQRAVILKAVRDNQVVVICGETGCGKTTQVGQMLLEEAFAAKKGGTVSIVITQPRRIAATSVARRIASEQAEIIGCSVGYSIRLDSTPPRPWGGLEVVTTGIVAQRLQKDPALLSMTHLILDEVHERDITCDILMAIAKQILALRKDFKLILMSATMEAERFCRYFGGCPMVFIPGLMYPVEEFFLEDALQLTGFRDFPSPPQLDSIHCHRRRDEMTTKWEEHRRATESHLKKLKGSGKYSDEVLNSLKNPTSEDLNADLVAELVRHLARGAPGAILVFMPGVKDISNVCERLNSRPLPPHILLPLHSHLNSSDQAAIFKAPPPGVRKIIVSTNIAETSITIDDVVYVVDCGKMKLTHYDEDTDIRILQAEWVSKANAHQRRGRAGRVQAGQCWHLFSGGRADLLDKRPIPEILRSPLHEPLLAVLLLRLSPPQPFLSSLLDAPSPTAIVNAVCLLTRMGILDEKERLTPLGVHVARLPVAPGAARMLLLSALLSSVDPISSVAAVAAFKDPFLLPIGKEKEVGLQRVRLACGHSSDQFAAAEAQRQWARCGHSEAKNFCRDFFLSSSTLKLLGDMRQQFGDLLHAAGFTSSPDPCHVTSNRHAGNPALFKALVVAGLYPNVATYKGKTRLQTEGEGMSELHPSSVNARAPQPASRLVYGLKQRSTRIFLHETSPAHPLPLLFFGDRFCIQEVESGSGVVTDPTEVLISCGGGKWTTKRSTALILSRLRDSLHLLLQLKLQAPTPVRWDGPEGKLLTAVIELLSEEDLPGPSGS